MAEEKEETTDAPDDGTAEPAEAAMALAGEGSYKE